MKLNILIITALITASTIPAYTKTRISSEVSLAGSTYGFMIACVNEGFILTDKSKAFVQRLRKAKQFALAAASEMKGYSLGSCPSAFEEIYGKNGKLSKVVGFQLIADAKGNTTAKDSFQLISGAEIAYMEKVCKVGMILTPRSIALIKKTIAANKPWFSAIYLSAEESYGTGQSACDILMFEEYNTHSEKNIKLGFEVWKKHEN